VGAAALEDVFVAVCVELSATVPAAGATVPTEVVVVVPLGLEEGETAGSVLTALDDVGVTTLVEMTVALGGSAAEAKAAQRARRSVMDETMVDRGLR